MDEPVTTTEIYHVAPGYESDFYSWGNALLKELARSSSFLGGQVLDPGRTDGDWQLVHRWTDSDIAVSWLESATRARWLDTAAPFARPRRPTEPARVPARRPGERVRAPASGPVERVRAPASGPVERVRAPVLAPTSVESAKPGPAPPPKWKTAVVTLIAVFPPVLFFNVTLIPQLRSVNVVARTLVLCVGVTVVVTWVMMPRLQPLFRGWLNSSAQRGFPWRIGTLRAATVVRVRDDDELPTRRQAALGAAPAERSLLAPADTTNDLADRYGERNSSRSGRASYLHQSSPDRRDPR